jgi:hypothetical protein
LLTAPIEPAIDAVTARIEPLGGEIAAVRFGAARGAIEARVDAVAALIEPLLDAVAAPVRALRRMRRSLRGADQQPQTKSYCTEFHFWPP